MKLVLLGVAALFTTAAAAAEPHDPGPDTLRDRYAAMVSKPMPRDPDLERSGYYARRDYYDSLNPPMPQRSFTTEEINKALDFFDRPHLGTSRDINAPTSHAK